MIDVVVVGAGAAGLAASRMLRSAGLTVLTVEAKDRIGGRAHTDHTTFGIPWDRGAHWLHDAEHNPLRAFADDLGIAYDRGPRTFVIHGPAGFVGHERKEEIQRYRERSSALIAEAGARGEDRAAAEVVPPHETFRAMFDSGFAAFNGVEPERMSTLDYARSIDGGNWPVVDGYGALLSRVARDVPVRTGTRALAIGLRPQRVEVTTSAGTIQASHVLLTVSTDVLASGAIAFDPDLPKTLREAARALPLGEANKIAVAFGRNVFGRDDHHFLAFENRTLETIRFDVCPAGRNLALGYVGGSFAREIEAAGADAMTAFALDHLVRAYGSDLRRHLVGTACTGWCGDPDVRGGYSCARPGHAAARFVLHEPVYGRIHLAGEAASIGGYGTVHGAWQSGEATAPRIVAAMSLRRQQKKAGPV